MTEYRFTQSPDITLRSCAFGATLDNGPESKGFMGEEMVRVLVWAGIIEEVKPNIVVEIPYDVAGILTNGYASDGEPPGYADARFASLRRIREAFRTQTAESRGNVGNALDTEG